MKTEKSSYQGTVKSSSRRMLFYFAIWLILSFWHRDPSLSCDILPTYYMTSHMVNGLDPASTVLLRDILLTDILLHEILLRDIRKRKRMQSSRGGIS